MTLLQEGLAQLQTEIAQVPSKKMPVFYNPVMKRNRNLTVALLNAIDKIELNIADPLAASGIRAVRLALELEEGKIGHIAINDGSEEAVKLIKENLGLNKIDLGKVSVSCMDANDFLLQSKGFDYIDIDPFGTPNPFLDSAVKRLARDGILAVTATDTAPLCGTYPKPCRRKYWSEPLRNSVMHETGLRILIRKIQLIGMQYDKALTPILSYADEHYFRVFLTCRKSRESCDEIYKQHKYFHMCPKCMKMQVSEQNNATCCDNVNIAGPLWTGKLCDIVLLQKMLKKNSFIEEEKLLRALIGESAIDAVGFYELSEVVSKHKLGMVPKADSVVAKLKADGFPAARSHFGGIRTLADISDVIKAIEAIGHRESGIQ